MDTERPHEHAGRPAGQEQDSWLPAQPAFGVDDTPPADVDADPERGPLGADRVGAGLGDALRDGAADVAAEGRDTLGAPDIDAAPGFAESMGAGEEGT